MGCCFSKRPKFQKIPTSDVGPDKQIGCDNYFYNTEGRKCFAIPEGGFQKVNFENQKKDIIRPIPDGIPSPTEPEDNPPKYEDCKKNGGSRMVSKDDSTGALMSLIAYGDQDAKYLTGNPQITLFKPLYRRHTNFSMEIESQEPAKLGDKVVYNMGWC